MRNIVSFIAITVCLCLGDATTAAGQADRGDRVTPCEKATKTIENGHPAHKMDAALAYLVWCGNAGAQLTASALTGTRVESDTAVLMRFYLSANRWRDAGIMNAAMQLVRDPAATVESRAFASMHLLGLLHPTWDYHYGDVIAGTRVVTHPDGSQRILSGCRVTGYGSEAPDAAATPLPADYATRIRAFLAQVANDATVPEPIRNTAACGEK